MSPDTLRIAQISDLHILAEPGATIYGVDTFVALQRIVDRIQRDAWRPDLVLATGDLTEDASAASYRRLHDMLASLEVPVHCLPGNHDDTPAMQAHLIGGNVHMPRDLARDAWRIVCLDSVVPQKIHGRLSADELVALRGVLDECPDSHVLIALHHGPVRVCPIPGCHLENDDELFSLLAAYPNVRGVVSGHLHCAVDETRHGVRMMVTPSTCVHGAHPTEMVEGLPFLQSHTLDRSRRAYRRLELSAGGEIHTEVVWDLDAEA